MSKEFNKQSYFMALSNCAPCDNLVIIIQPFQIFINKKLPLEYNLNFYKKKVTYFKNLFISSSLAQVAEIILLSSDSGCVMPLYAAWHVSL